MKTILLAAILLCLVHTLQGSKCVGNGTSRSKKLPWCLPASYDKKKPPFLFTADEGEDKDKDMNLHFTFSVREVSKVTDEDQTLQIPMYFTVSWTDERLSVEQEHRAWKKSTTGPVNMSTEDAETLKLLWKPNLEIYGLQEFKKHNILSEMAGLRVSRSKRITFDIKVTIVISCQMSFNDYPFDGHTCFFQVGSYFYDRNSMTCSADFHDPKSSNIQERNLQYYINFRKLRRSRGVVRLHSGDYAACGFEVLLRRKHEPLIYQVYIPCCLFVFVSWISFIIDPKVVPGRMSLLVILLLVLVNVFNSVRSNAPSSGLSKLNAIDTFIMTCIFMVFSTILEYAIVLSILAFELDKEEYEINTERPALRDRICMILQNPRKLDKLAVAVFSISFALYNFNYWVIMDHNA